MSDASTYTAQQFVNWLSQGTIATAPDSIYVALFDDTGSEVSGDFANKRVQTTAGTDWNVTGTNDTDFENANQIDFGEASVDVNNIETVRLYDDSLANGGNEITQTTLDNAPVTIAAGSNGAFETGSFTFDVIDVDGN